VAPANENASRTETAVQLLKYGGGQLPTLNPLITIGSDAFAYMSGRNPYDAYRGRPKIDETVFRAQNAETLKAVAGNMWNDLGGTLIYRFKGDSDIAVKTELEQVLGMPIIDDIVGRFIKVSDRGNTEYLRELANDEEKTRARTVLRLRDIARKQARGQKLSAEEAEFAASEPGYMQSRMPKERARVAGDAYMSALLAAPSKEARHKMQLAIMEREKGNPDFDIWPYIQKDVVAMGKVLLRELPGLNTKNAIRRRRELREAQDEAKQWLAELGVSRLKAKRLAR